VCHAGFYRTTKDVGIPHIEFSHSLPELWGGDADVQYLRVYIRALRQKIEPDPEQPRYILTEQGVGYRMRSPD
jgi:two-component system KDP operon response regulator KdpE